MRLSSSTTRRCGALSEIGCSGSGAATMDVSGLGAISIVTITGTTLSSIPAGTIGVNIAQEAFYDGSHFILRSSSQYTDPLTTNGDLLIRSGGATTRLAGGLSGQNLTANSSGIPAWLSPANIGTQTIWIPAAAMVARTTSGANGSPTQTAWVMIRLFCPD